MKMQSIHRNGLHAFDEVDLANMKISNSAKISKSSDAFICRFSFAAMTMFVVFVVAAPLAKAKNRPAPTPTPSPFPQSSSFVRAYGNSLNQVEYGLTPESVQATSDGGYIALALTDS